MSHNRCQPGGGYEERRDGGTNTPEKFLAKRQARKKEATTSLCKTLGLDRS